MRVDSGLARRTRRWAKPSVAALLAIPVLLAVVLFVGLSSTDDAGDDSSGATATPAMTAPAPAPSTTPSPSPSNTPSPATETSDPAQVAGPEDVERLAGVRDVGALRPSASVTVDEDGTVVENLDVTGVINIKANDVTVRNVRLRSPSKSFGINVHGNTSGTLIENVEIEMGVGGADANAAIGGAGGGAPANASSPGDNITVRFAKLHGTADGIKAFHFGLYEYNYIAMRRVEGSKKHIDGIQGSGSGNWTARYNWIDQAYAAGHNAAIFLQAYTGKVDRPVHNVVMENNWVNGGVYTLHFENGKKAEGQFLHNVVVRDNVFFRDYKYGAYRPEGPGIQGNGGVWADTGEQVPIGAIKG